MSHIPHYLAEGGECAAGEEDNPLHLLDVEEVVEAPQGSVLPVCIGGELWVVGEDVTISQIYFLGKAKLVKNLLSNRYIFY